MFDIKLAKDFKKQYFTNWLWNTTKTLPPEYMECFYGYAGNNIHVRIGRTNYAAGGINKADFAIFIFRNTIEAINRPLCLPLKYTTSDYNNKAYYQFKINDLDKLPFEFTNLLLNNRKITESKTYTNFSRLVAGCRYILMDDKKAKYHIHHKDGNHLNDNICNLFPVHKLVHIDILHDPKISKDIKSEILCNYALSRMDSSSEYRKYSKEYNEEVLFTVNYLKYIKGYSGRYFDEIKKYESVALPSGRTMRKYLKDNIYREFEAFFYYITGNTEKLSTIIENNFNVVPNNSA